MSWFDHAWLRRESWPLLAASKLLAKMDPDVVRSVDPNTPSGRRYQLCDHLYEDLKDAVDSRALPSLGSRTNEYVTTRVRPWDAIQWARAKGYDIPAELLTIPEAPPLEAAERRDTKSAERPLTTTERNTLLTIIAVVCDYSDIKVSERGAATQIAKLAEEQGVAVTDDTIRKVLQQIPQALAIRKK
jgi:hypothetical protein